MMEGIKFDANIITFNGFIDGRSSAATVKRWDGVSQSSTEWNSLRRDPELWLASGTCLVYLYEKGQSRRGPSFKVPFSALMSAKCYPLIDQFLVVDGPRPRTVKDLERWGRLASKRSIELFIPAPIHVNKTEAFEYHLATRNFFAWIYGRPLVGQHLGGALAGLLHSMHEFRAGGVDHVGDLMAYMDEQGYSDLVCQPDYALAALHLADSSQMKELYIRSFSHCVGMSDMLYNSTEYQHVSRATKKLIRKSRSDMDSKLYQASDMLRNFLDEELSKSRLGVPAGARAHLERFRSFLLSFYAGQLGYYPPRCFDPDLLRAMREDFEALYDLLVDEQCTQTGIMPGAAGGICTLQLVQSFDARCRYRTLDNPLPLLPEFSLKPSKKPTWMSRDAKLRPDDRLVAHAALVKASNWKGGVFHNDLVRAYRKFEENSIVSPNKSDKREIVSIADARKVRWVLIYAIYQVLRSVTDEPPEVMDQAEVPYHLAVDASELPPWENGAGPKSLSRKHTEIGTDSTVTLDWSDGEEGAPGVIEIKPDIDYFALTRGDNNPRGRQMSMSTSHPRRLSLPSRSSSLTRALSRSRPIRNSIKMFKSVTSSSPGSTPSPKASPYHEIVVQGYGNGTNHVRVEQSTAKAFGLGLTVRCDSTASTLSAKTTPSLNSSASTIESAETPAASTDSRPSPHEFMQTSDEQPVNRRMLPVLKDVTNIRRKEKPSKRYTMGNMFDIRSYSAPYEQLVAQEKAKIFPDLASQPVSRRNSLIVDLKRVGRLASSRSVPERLHDMGARQKRPSHDWDQDEWHAMEAFMGDSSPQAVLLDDGATPAWEQYADLGGFKSITMS